MGFIVIALIAFVLTGCTGTSYPSSSSVANVNNNLGKVADRQGDYWRIKEPPQLKFTGKTTNYSEIIEWAGNNGFSSVQMQSMADVKYAQLEASSAIETILWLKRFQWDIGYDYVNDARDCDNFARLARTFPDLYADRAPEAQAAVFGVYAKMDKSFAGVSDGYHALNIVWTDKGLFIFEPQGIDLIYQKAENWVNRDGITAIQFD